MEGRVGERERESLHIATFIHAYRHKNPPDSGFKPVSISSFC